MAAMETILPNSILPAASTARGFAEQGEMAGSPDTACSGENRFESILKSAVAGEEDPVKSRPSAQGGRRAAIAGKKAEADTSTPPSVSAAAWSPVAPTAPDDSLAATGVVVSESDGAGSVNADPVPVLADAATSPAGEEPLLKQLSSGKTAPVPVLADAATSPAGEDPLLKLPSSGTQPAAADGEENAAPAQAPKAGGPVPVSASPPAAASEPNDAGSASVDGTPVNSYGGADPAPEGVWGADGTRKKRDDASPRTEGQAEPVGSAPAGGSLGVAERTAPPRPVGPASDPGAVRLEEKAFVITRKSDTSVEVTLAPPGVGKLEIEVVLEKGIVNARITAADPAGREAIERSLPQIVEALARDGMNIGGFSVSLKERRDRTGDASARGAARDSDARLPSAVTPAAPASAASAGLVDIFV